MEQAESLSKAYEPRDVEGQIRAFWDAGNHFHAEPDDRPRDKRFSIVIPPPNVTGALHLGHGINNTLQDMLIRWKRMCGYNTLWMPGTDHAGIATQAVVEKRLFEEEGKTRKDIGRDALVERIWKWKDAYEARILNQLRLMGCSCDWARTRFTLDDVCARAVRHTFFRFFSEGLIYRGKRLVNWDTQLQTAVSDDEVYHETVKGHFWHLRYPLKNPGDGDPRWLIVATTRPETMLGDTAVAVHPTDERYRQLVGKTVNLPLLNREIPILADEWAKPEMGSGCVKITPAHDPNDYMVGLRQNLEMINVLNPDGTINANGGPYEGLDRFAARKRVIADLEAQGLLERIEDRDIEVGHSDRSKSPIEPFLADQWFLKMDRLAQIAMDAVTDGRVKIHPERYAKTYLDWLGEKRDWPIGRQLWWGHRIPIWYCQTCSEEDLAKAFEGREDVSWRWDENQQRWQICVREEDPPVDAVAGHELVQDEEVLDTWFSSGLWPHSTLGWPERTAELEYYYPTSVLITSRDIITLWVARMVLMGVTNVGSVPFHEVYIHPKILDGLGETMSKSKGNGVDPVDIIEKYGADALRFSLALMATETQDIRMPVEYDCPHCDALIPQSRKNMTARTVNCPQCGKTFATRWADEATQSRHGLAWLTSDKFEIGRNFSNKLWNAARFAFMNVEGAPCEPIRLEDLPVEDRWILAEVAAVARETNERLAGYQFSRSVNGLRGFFWDKLCDWYLELAKSRFRDENRAGEARQVLAFCLDQVLRLFHPTIPFITERLWRQLNAIAPRRGLPGVADVEVSEALTVAAFPPADGWAALRDDALRETFAELQDVTRGVREVRSRYNVPPKQSVDVTIKVSAEHAEGLRRESHIIERMARVGSLTIDPEARRAKNAATIVAGDMQIFVADIADDEADRQKLAKELEGLEKQIRGGEGKLANENFVKRAKPEVVARERERLVELRSKRDVIRAHLDSLSV